MNHLASLYIDDELTLYEKMDFVDAIHGDREFYRDTKELIEQEVLISGDMTVNVPDVTLPRVPDMLGWKGKLLSIFKPMGFGFAGTCVALLVLFVLHNPRNVPETRLNRFVIYRPDAAKVEITGSFTKWEKIPLHAVGSSGYWEANLAVPKGVHRFTYILDGHTPFADPTVPASEMDDFGGVDSILTEI
jgi:hypothetical protein